MFTQKTIKHALFWQKLQTSVHKKNEIFQIQNGVKSYEVLSYSSLWPVNTKNNEIQEKLDDFQDEKTVIILVENLEKLKGFLLLINESIYK